MKRVAFGASGMAWQPDSTPLAAGVARADDAVSQRDWPGEKTMEGLNAWAPRVLSLLRIVAGLQFLEHGTMKLFQFPVAQPGVTGPLPPILMGAATLELVGGALLVLGLFTRPVAFIVSGEMAVAYFTYHFAQGPWPGANGGDAAILFCWVFFYLVFAGPGPWSLDTRMKRAA